MKSKRILLIEDDLELSEELAESLQHEGYSIDCCPDPLKGETMIRTCDYDIILLDYKMSALTGLDILKKLKRDNIRKLVFIITGRPSVERLLEDEDLLDMVKKVIRKPFSFKVLLENIKGI